MIRAIEGGNKYRVEVKRNYDRRTLAQNSLLHLWCNESSREYATIYGPYYKPVSWKEYFKQMFLGEESTNINGRIVTWIKRTSDLNKKEFTEFLNNIDIYMASEFNIQLSHPEDVYLVAMAA